MDINTSGNSYSLPVKLTAWHPDESVIDPNEGIGIPPSTVEGPNERYLFRGSMSSLDWPVADTAYTRDFLNQLLRTREGINTFVLPFNPLSLQSLRPGSPRTPSFLYLNSQRISPTFFT